MIGSQIQFAYFHKCTSLPVYFCLQNTVFNLNFQALLYLVFVISNGFYYLDYNLDCYLDCYTLLRAFSVNQLHCFSLSWLFFELACFVVILCQNMQILKCTHFSGSNIVIICSCLDSTINTYVLFQCNLLTFPCMLVVCKNLISFDSTC